jgi:hypothetical protein
MTGSHDTDPLLRAIKDGDPACPDGRTLVALGALIRAHSEPAAVQLGESVLNRLHGGDAIADDRLRAIDLIYDGAAHDVQDGEALDPDLARLRALLARARTGPPRAVDLTAAVRRKLKQSARLRPAGRIDGASRWRLWSAVAIVHVAAALLLGLVLAVHEHGGGNDWRGDGADISEATSVPGQGGSQAGHHGDPAHPDLPTSRLPVSWDDLRESGGDLLLLRRFPELRAQSRAHYGMAASTDVVDHGLAWLIANQGPDGAFAPPTGDNDRDLATQSLATLALLGEGLGDSKHDKQRVTAMKRGLAWIAPRIAGEQCRAYGPVPTGLGALALVEGALLLNDTKLRTDAEHCLATMDTGAPVQPGAAGLGGFTLLALETASQGGLAVPPRWFAHARDGIGRSLPSQEDDAGRLGLAAFARLTRGFRDRDSTAHLLGLLGGLEPKPNATGQVNPLGWFFATLALRDAGGPTWDAWAKAMQAQLIPAFTPVDAQGLSHVPAAKVHYASPDASGDVFATSLSLLNLQVAYRYLPVQ